MRNFLQRLMRPLAPVSAAMPRKQQQIAAVIEAQRAVTACQIAHVCVCVCVCVRLMSVVEET